MPAACSADRDLAHWVSTTTRAAIGITGCVAPADRTCVIVYTA